MQHKKTSNIKLKRNLLLVIIIGIPFLTLIGSGVTIYLAIKTSDSPAISSYYKKGLHPNENTNEHDNAIKMGLQAQMTISPNHTVISLSKPIAHDSINLMLQHPTLAKKDKYIVMHKESDNTFSSQENIQLSDATHWYVFLSNIADDKHPAWELSGEIRKGSNTTTLLP